MRRAAVALLAVAASVSGCDIGGVDRDAYVDRNEELLAGIPVYPGATQSDDRASPYRGADGEGNAQGYITTRVFGLPTGTTRDRVAGFYRARLTRWRLVMDQTEARGERVLSFCRGRASVGVNLESVGVVEVSADHDAFGKLGRPVSCATAGRLKS